MKSVIAAIVLMGAGCVMGCQTPIERRKEAAHLDSLRMDSARPPNNPYRLGKGTEMYNQERENLGNLDSLVTPQQPTVPSP